MNDLKSKEFENQQTTTVGLQ